MKLTVTKAILGFDSEPLTRDEKKLQADGSTKVEAGPLLLRHVLVTALNAPGPRYQEETVEEKFRRGFLAIEIHVKDEVELTAEDVAMMKKLVALGWAPVIVYRANQILEQRD